jgi:uncharacterized RDD family membrane protein YckC
MSTNSVVESSSGIFVSRTRIIFLRIGAGLIDFVILASLQIWISSVFGIVNPSGSYNLLDGAGLSLFVGGNATIHPLWLYLIAFLYFIVQEALFSTTVGKILLGLHVVGRYGKRLTFLAALLRNLLRFIDMLPLFYLVGFISSSFSPTFQRVGDRLARTVVMPIKVVPTAVYSRSQVLMRYIFVSIGVMIFVGFCLHYIYYDRPPLVLQSWVNINNSYEFVPSSSMPSCGKVKNMTGDYVVQRQIQLVQIKPAQWHNGTVTYHVVYKDNVRCNGSITLQWRGFFDGGWSVAQVDIQS